MGKTKLTIRYLHYEKVQVGSYHEKKNQGGKNLIDNCSRYLHYEKVQVGNDHEKAHSERNSHSKNRGGENLIDN